MFIAVLSDSGAAFGGRGREQSHGLFGGGDAAGQRPVNQGNSCVVAREEEIGNGPPKLAAGCSRPL